MKKKMFSFGDVLEIYDEHDDCLYVGKANEHSKLVNILLYDHQEKVIASLMEVVPAKQPTFEIALHDKLFTTVYKEDSWQWQSFLAKTEHEQRIHLVQPFHTSYMQIINDDVAVGTIRRDRYSWRECFTIDLDSKDLTSVYLLMLLLMIIFYDKEPPKTNLL
ncbi:MAG: hypothetical protein R3Y63_10755 [Eubacteriales bacterium]